MDTGTGAGWSGARASSTDWSGTVECPMCEGVGPYSVDTGLYRCHGCNTVFAPDGKGTRHGA